MRAVIQRVKESRVEVKGETVGRIGRGLLVLLGVGENDTEDDSRYLADKVSSEDPRSQGRRNRKRRADFTIGSWKKWHPAACPWLRGSLGR